jgi:NhaP-type Na+/H+ or K+/H+ antiporter
VLPGLAVTLDLLLTVVGALAVAVAALSGRLRELPLSEPLLALALGVVAGPQLVGVVDLPDDVLLVALTETSRLLLAVSLMGVALRFPLRELRAEVRPLVLLVGIVMPLSALAGAGIAAVAVGLPLGVALVVGACLSPTDPVLASSIVSGRPAERQLARRLRLLVTAESGSNDGLALPLVALAVAGAASALHPASFARVTYEVLGAVAVGVVLGGLASVAVRWAERRDEVEHSAELLFTMVLGLFVLGAAQLLGTDAVLAVFVAGLTYNGLASKADRTAAVPVDEGINRYLVLPMFFLLGLALPWERWQELGWQSAVLVVGVLALRRLPFLLLLRRPLGLTRPDAVFLGWFGPMGVSSLFYVLLAAEEGVDDPRLFPVVTLVVAASTVVHGVTAAAGRSWHARRSPRPPSDPAVPPGVRGQGRTADANHRRREP